MPRAATNSDVFNAIAEARRRDILTFLAGSERPVGDIVDALGMRLAKPDEPVHSFGEFVAVRNVADPTAMPKVFGPTRPSTIQSRRCAGVIGLIGRAGALSCFLSTWGSGLGLT